MADNWRVIDTGLRPAAQSIALNRALLEAREAEEIPSTLRFLRCTPAALLGWNQSAEQEFNLDYCRAHGIPVQRRISGGPAVHWAETQLGWELYLHRRDVGTIDMPGISRRLCHAAATAVSALGINARYRPRQDIEVDGRRISETGSAVHGDALLFQGTLFIDCDLETMVRVSRLPVVMPFDEAVTAMRERVTTLKALLGRQPDAALVKRYLTEAYESEFGIEFAEGDLTLSEYARYQAALRGIETPAWVDVAARPVSEMPVLGAARNFAGRMLRAGVKFDTTTQTIRQAWFTGDIVVNPKRALADLEAALRDLPADRLAQKVRWFFASRPVDMPGLAPDDFITVVRLAVGRPLLAQNP